MTRRTLLLSLLLVISFGINAQKDLRLFNSSFEDRPQSSQPPRGWFSCGFPEESPPDIQPGNFEVNKPPFHGNTYLGMVTRDNRTWEAVSQQLSGTMVAGKCYAFSLQMARSDEYKSVNKPNLEVQLYNNPVILRIWGGNDTCDHSELLGVSRPVKNTEWKSYSFMFHPKKDYTFVILEAFYRDGVTDAYNGNILLDSLSQLRIIPCPDMAYPDATSEMPVTATGKDIFSNHVKAADLHPNEIMRIDNLYFPINSSALTPQSYLVLNELHAFLEKNAGIEVEIGGHTNGLCDDDYCMELSTARAKAVADYLIKKGIPKQRVIFQGYGKSQPIAPNNTQEGKEKNQRVEVKFTKIQ